MAITYDAGAACCAGPEEFLALAGRWKAGDPFPVLAGEPVERYRALFPEDLPVVRRTSRPGTVLSTGDEVTRATAALLAAATGRPHRHVAPDLLLKELAEHPDELVAVVARPADLVEAGDWPGAGGARVGVLTARSAAALSCLVYRTLTCDEIPDDGVLVASHPLLTTGEHADVVLFDEFAGLRSRRVRALFLAGLGRECSLSFPDGIICGRSDAVDGRSIPVAAGLRALPCLHGAGCFRLDLTDAERLPAASVNATLVFAHSCSSVPLGVNAYPEHVSLALGLVDGTAVAVVGVRGVHLAQRGAEQELAAALAEQLPLGDVVRRMEDRSRPMRSVFQSFGLVGDPALVLRPPGGLSAHPALAAPQGGPTVDDPAVERLRRLDQVVLPRLERLRWLQVDFGDPDELAAVRDRVRRVAGKLTDPELAGQVELLEDEVAAVQHAAVGRMTEVIYDRGWDFVGPVMSGLEQVERVPTVCPQCARSTAVLVALAHRVDPALRLRSLQCRRCGDVWWSTADDELSLSGPLDLSVRRESPGVLDRRLTNRGRHRARGAVGFAYRIRKKFHLPPPRSVACDVAPGTAQEVAFPLDLRSSAAQPDTHTGIVIALVDGVFIESYAMVRLDP